MLFSKKSKDGRWRLKFYNGNGYYTYPHETEAVSFSTKRDAEATRRVIEREYMNIDRDPRDFYHA
jgi:hypothetical protein